MLVIFVEHHHMYFLDKIYTKDFINEDIPNSFFIGSRMISNIAFPNKEISENGYESLDEEDVEIMNLKKYSPKYHKIIKKVKKCDGPVFIYSNFKEYGGIKTFIKCLEAQNFKNYANHGSGEKRFAIWTGDQDPMYKEEVKAVYNSKNNKDGGFIKIILGSPS